MATPPKIRALLWKNLVALMNHHWGHENLNRLARATKTSPSTVLRVKNLESSVGIDIVEQLAQVFGLHANQILDPGLDPANPKENGPPRLATPPWPFEVMTPDQYSRLSETAKARVEGFALAQLPQGPRRSP